jgi:hypothetical protein
MELEFSKFEYTFTHTRQKYFNEFKFNKTLNNKLKYKQK